MTRLPGNPLVVDLDGTLTRSDLLYESVCGLLKKNILYGFMLPVWLMRGKAAMKQEIADRVDVDVELLPWNTEFVDYLKDQKEAGRRLILATASNEKYAQQVADYHGIFDDVIASGGDGQNASGSNKVERVKALLGDEAFDYAGNSAVDLKVWEHAENAVLVDAAPGLEKQALEIVNVERVFDNRQSQFRMFLKAMRGHQWLKNLLLFVPAMLAREIADPSVFLNVCLAFVSFSLCASSVYLLNDLFDLSSDRQHPRKCKRPFAAGNLSLATGLIGVVVLLVVAFGIAFFLPWSFFFVLLDYYILTMAYSIVLKRAMFIDVLVLAALYTMRLIAGAAAAEVEASFWLLAFSMFTFLSLALIKRYSELLVKASQGDDRVAGRAYRFVDLESLSQMGAASGYAAVLVLALYIDSDEVSATYHHPEALWLFCPMMLYWISRLWILTRRGEMHDDPVVFTIRDRRTHWLGLIAVLVMAAAVLIGDAGLQLL